MAPRELTGIHTRLGEAVSGCLSRREIQPGEISGFENSVVCCCALSDGSVIIKLRASLNVDQGIIGRFADQLPIMVVYVDREECFRFNNQAYVNFDDVSRENLYGQGR
ncbi:hypothetical protein QC823_14935 [Halomonas vilamensis]|uniref:Uncharacterized protein n=1 Tax=Vreelandella vilamensis TaxID=531309 RepID=A0ABU1H7S2_9GAMM|nr:hypothetical protein [Halomonas vilamensis]MDR5900264.1 hypothetical protein [Halomonas vilamensis]